MLIGREGRKYEEGERAELWRNSKDKLINSEGEELPDMMEERRWEIRNGNTWKDEERDWTCIGSRRTSVVVYVLSNYMAGNKIEKLKIGKRVESDHQPVEVTLKMQRNRERRRGVEEIWINLKRK